jgi:hypothetical protein
MQCPTLASSYLAHAVDPAGGDGRAAGHARPFKLDLADAEHMTELQLLVALMTSANQHARTGSAEHTVTWMPPRRRIDLRLDQLGEITPPADLDQAALRRTWCTRTG